MNHGFHGFDFVIRAFLCHPTFGIGLPRRPFSLPKACSPWRVVGENLRSSPATAGRKRVILQPIRVIRDIRGCLFSATSAISACHAVAVAEAGGEMIGAIHLNSEGFRELGSAAPIRVRPLLHRILSKTVQLLVPPQKVKNNYLTFSVKATISTH